MSVLLSDKKPEMMPEAATDSKATATPAPQAESSFSFQLSRFQLLRKWLPLAIFSVLWLDLIRQLSYMWETNEQYAFGWFVPILALGLFWRRWLTRPKEMLKTEKLTTETGSHSKPISAFQRFSVSAFIVLLCLLYLPLRVIHEVNQDWALITWLLALSVVFLTLFAVHLAGPRAEDRRPKTEDSGSPSVLRLPSSVLRLSPWVWHFAFPICFILVAVRWPYRIENSLTYRLMTVVTSLTVELLGWLGVPAAQHGHVIEVATGMVGVEEACSGIRSFQSSLMGALFLGELYLLNWPRRFGLIVGGVVLAFCFNVLRTLFLTWEASAHGVEAIDKWHDSAGMTIFLITFACLWAVALGLRRAESRRQQTEDGGQRAEDRGQKSEDGSQRSEDRGQRTEGGSHLSASQNVSISAFRDQSPSSVLGPRSSGNPPSTVHRPQSTDGVHRPPSTVHGLLSSVSPASSLASEVRRSTSLGSLQPCRRYLVAVGLWSLLCIGATEAWYRSHEVNQSPTPTWWVQFPTNLPSAREIPMSKTAREKLKYDEGTTLAWEEPDGSRWSGYCFRWNAGVATSRLAARDHRPEYCLGGSGYNCQADFGVHYLPSHGLELPFRTYTFERSGVVLYVFHCLWENGAVKQRGFGTSKYLDRLETVLQGKRRLGQQTLEIIVSGYRNIKEAEEAVRRDLPDLIHIEKTGQSTMATIQGMRTDPRAPKFPE